MSTSRTFQIKMVRPDEDEMSYFWKLFHAAQRVEDRWGHGLSEIAEELSHCPDMTREQKLFLLRAWQVLAADKGGFGRLMGAYDTYVYNLQDPDKDYVTWKPEFIELLGAGELLPIVLDAYSEAQNRISELEQQLADSRHEFTAADSTADVLQMRLEKMAAENAGLKEANGIALKILNDEETMVTSLWASSVQKVEVETPVTDAFMDDVRASAIPDGYVLVPQEMHLSSEAMEGICYHCGDGDQKFGEFTDGLLFVGDVDYGDGKNVHGLHIATADYPEEGCATICEFAAQLRKGGQS